ncbi:hypothetical protein WJX81_000742 [Elliptochloris bilobata]|uniref:Lipoyl-binding domain-containing protein n=1 Tax=Elliptochloris bilobata TaxID=381761 RepID=A0AAW1RMS5_9CHLO
MLEEPETLVEVLDEDDFEEDEEEFEESEIEDTSGLSAEQVYSLLDVLCDKSDVVQVELKVGDFEMRVQRSLTGAGSSGSLSTAPSSNGVSTPELAFPVPPPGTAFVSTYSMDVAALEPEPEKPVSVTQSLDEDLEDESTIYLGSPKVGYLRRGRYNKGKRVGKAVMLQAGDKVKKGQVLGYIEQLGTFMPVEAPLAGEIIAYLAEEGDPVEYRQELVEIAPYFGGHIIGDKKNF